MVQGGVRLFIDKLLAPLLATRLNETGRPRCDPPGETGSSRPATVHCRRPRDRHADRRDFRRLAARTELHPGLIILPFMDREGTWRLLQGAIAFPDAMRDPMNAMVNHALE